MAESVVEKETKTAKFSEPDFVENDFRSISKAAVFSLITGVLGISSFVFSSLVVLCLVALVTGAIGLINILRFPNDLLGRKVAIAGLVLGGICLPGSIGYHAYIYSTEVPDGYNRLTWRELQPKDANAPSNAISEKAVERTGDNVFIRGYVYPSKGKKQGLKTLIMVNSQGTCCFGGQPKLTHMMQVDIKNGTSVNYSLFSVAFGGKFIVENQLRKAADVGAVAYRLEADYVK